MTPGEAWAALGIAPTDDQRAIRTAYSTKLKAIDPEVDPQAFIVLRAAFDLARGLPDDDSSTHPLPPAPEAPYFTAVREPDAPASSADAKPRDHGAEHAQAIATLLYGHNRPEPWLAEDSQERLIQHWRALERNPKLEQLDYAARVERWASIVIAETSPLSAPILMLAAERFGWVDADKAARADPHIMEVARSYRMLHLLRTAHAAGTRHHAAWIELTTPADVFSSHGNVDPLLVFEVIAAMRYALPQLAGQFDPLRLESWEEHAARGYAPNPSGSFGGCLWRIVGGYLILLLILFALGAVGIIASAIGAYFQ